jgi:hypothetical protein
MKAREINDNKILYKILYKMDYYSTHKETVNDGLQYVRSCGWVAVNKKKVNPDPGLRGRRLLVEQM